MPYHFYVRLLLRLPGPSAPPKKLPQDSTFRALPRPLTAIPACRLPTRCLGSFEQSRERHVAPAQNATNIERTEDGRRWGRLLELMTMLLLHALRSRSKR